MHSYCKYIKEIIVAPELGAGPIQSAIEELQLAIPRLVGITPTINEAKAVNDTFLVVGTKDSVSYISDAIVGPIAALSNDEGYLLQTITVGQSFLTLSSLVPQKKQHYMVCFICYVSYSRAKA